MPFQQAHSAPRVISRVIDLMQAHRCEQEPFSFLLMFVFSLVLKNKLQSTENNNEMPVPHSVTQRCCSQHLHVAGESLGFAMGVVWLYSSRLRLSPSGRRCLPGLILFIEWFCLRIGHALQINEAYILCSYLDLGTYPKWQWLLIMNIFLKLDKVIACELLMSMILFILEFFFDRYCSVLIKCKDW